MVGNNDNKNGINKEVVFKLIIYVKLKFELYCMCKIGKSLVDIVGVKNGKL